MVNKSILEEILVKIFTQSPTLITQIFDKGITNEVFIVDMPDGKLVIRISPEQNTSQFEKEKWQMEQAKQLGVLTPKVFAIGICKETVYMIEEYIDGMHGTETSLDRASIWKEFGAYAKIIHSIPVEGFGDYMSAAGKFEGSWDNYLDYDIQSLSDSDTLLSMGVFILDQSKKIKTLFESLKKEHFAIGLNHGDLSLKNVIVDAKGKVVLLDWGSSESHIIPYFDIVEVLQSSFKFDSKSIEFKAFISGLGLFEEEFLSMKPTVDKLMLLRAIDHLRWGIDKKRERVDHFKVVLREVLDYMGI